MSRDLPTVLRDTREELPLSPFLWRTVGGIAERVHLPTRDVGLETGDYSLPGVERLVIVERKSIPDLWGTCFGAAPMNSVGEAQRAQDRFHRELHRMRSAKRKWLLVEGSKGSLMAYARERYERNGSRGRGPEENVNSLLDILAAMEVDYGISLKWEGGREGAEAWLGRVLYRVWSQAMGGEKARTVARRGLTRADLPWLDEASCAEPDEEPPLAGGRGDAQVTAGAEEASDVHDQRRDVHGRSGGAGPSVHGARDESGALRLHMPRRDDGLDQGGGEEAQSEAGAPCSEARASTGGEVSDDEGDAGRGWATPPEATVVAADEAAARVPCGAVGCPAVEEASDEVQAVQQQGPHGGGLRSTLLEGVASAAGDSGDDPRGGRVDDPDRVGHHPGDAAAVAQTPRDAGDVAPVVALSPPIPVLGGQERASLDGRLRVRVKGYSRTLFRCSPVGAPGPDAFHTEGMVQRYWPLVVDSAAPWVRPPAPSDARVTQILAGRAPLLGVAGSYGEHEEATRRKRAGRPATAARRGRAGA